MGACAGPLHIKGLWEPFQLFWAGFAIARLMHTASQRISEW